MSGFRYRLEVPLRLARVRLSQQRREMAELLAEILPLEKALKLVREHIASCDRELLERARQGVRGEELHQLVRDRQRREENLSRLLERREQLEEQDRELKERIEETSRRIKVLEKQRQEKWKAYQKDLARREQALIDDVVLSRKAREALLERRGGAEAER